MSNDRRNIFEPGVGQTDRERFAEVDRLCAGLPPDPFRNWSEYEAAARQDSASKNAPEIQESIRAMEAQVEQEAQEDAVKHFGARAAEIRRTIKKLEASLDRIHELMAEEPDTYRGSDLSIIAKLDGARMELKRCLYRIAEARRGYDHKVREEPGEANTYGPESA